MTGHPFGGIVMSYILDELFQTWYFTDRILEVFAFKRGHKDF
jgi:hypothetical protein